MFPNGMNVSASSVSSAAALVEAKRAELSLRDVALRIGNALGEIRNNHAVMKQAIDEPTPEPMQGEVPRVAPDALSSLLLELARSAEEAAKESFILRERIG